MAHQRVLMKKVVERDKRHPQHPHLPFSSNNKDRICCKNIDDTSFLVSEGLQGAEHQGNSVRSGL